MSKTMIKDVLLFFLMAVVIGVFAVFFAKSCSLAFSWFLYMFNHVGYWILLIIPCGFIVITYMIVKYFPEAEGSGIPQALALGHTDDMSKLSRFFIARTIFSKYIFIVLGTLFGATVGREGSTVQIGATIMTLFRKNLSDFRKKVLLTAGAAAGLAAAFNTPLGGIVFLLEELAKGISLKRNLVKTTAIAVSGVVAVLLAGNFSYYGTVAHTFLNYDWKIFIVAIIIGIFAALNNYVFSKVVYFTTASPFSYINRLRKKHPLITSVLCGFLVAVVGIVSHGLSFGNGYVESRESLAGVRQLPMFYYVFKMFGSVLSTASGVPGGYFATCLAIGNGIGNFVHHFFAVANSQQYALLGMVAFLSALTQAPVTSLVMVLQVTYTQVFTLPLIVACLTATWISSMLDKSIYEYQISNYLNPKSNIKNDPKNLQ